MAARGRLKSALRGFVGTYTSRYSDHDGYWIFGLVEPHLDGWSVDLLSEASQLVPSHLAAAMELARRRFREQLAKARLPLSVVREATLTVARESSERGPVHGHYTAGHRFRFCVRVASDRGYTLHDEATIFVAPHDPRYELRSTRRT